MTSDLLDNSSVRMRTYIDLTPTSLSPQLPVLLPSYSDVLCSEIRSFRIETSLDRRKEGRQYSKPKTHAKIALP